MNGEFGVARVQHIAREVPHLLQYAVLRGDITLDIHGDSVGGLNRVRLSFVSRTKVEAELAPVGLISELTFARIREQEWIVCKLRWVNSGG